MMPSKPGADALATPDPDAELGGLSRAAAAEFATALGTRRRGAGAPIRKSFVSREFHPERPAVPPLAALLRGGGRGGQLRIKLYLSLLWVCARDPYATTRPARSWAALLGLADFEGRGVRRIHEAVQDLRDRRLLVVQDRGGLPNQLTLLDESGTGMPYTPPSEAYNIAKNQNASPEELRRHQYFRIPSNMWTDGYIHQLNGPGLAMLLVLLCEQTNPTAGVWITPERADERYKLAESTRSKGLNELRRLGLISTRTDVVAEGGQYVGFLRRRNVHRLKLANPSTTPSVADVLGT